MRKIKFKINGDVVFADNRELTLDDIDLVKKQIIKFFKVDVDDIEVATENFEDMISDSIDVGVDGLIFYGDSHHEPIIAIECIVPMDSDEFINAMTVGDVNDVLRFI